MVLLCKQSAIGFSTFYGRMMQWDSSLCDTKQTSLTGVCRDPFPGVPHKKPGKVKYAGFKSHNKGMYTLDSFPGLDKLSFPLRMALVNSAK